MKVKVRSTFALYLLGLWLIDGLPTLLSLILALLIHEAAHITVGCLIHEAFERVELTPFGGVIKYKAGKTCSKGIRGVLLAAAGPASNYAAMLVLAMPVFKRLPDELIRRLLMTNASMLLLNLLPVLPLDGGRIVFSLGYYLFPVTGLITFLEVLGVFTGVALMVLSLHGMLYIGKLNISLLAVGAYMAFCSREHGDVLLRGSFYTVLQERSSQSRSCMPVKIYAVRPDMKLIDMFSIICKTKKSACMIEHDEEIQIVGEGELINALLSAPYSTFAESFPAQKDTKTERNQ